MDNPGILGREGALKPSRISLCLQNELNPNNLFIHSSPKERRGCRSEI